MALVLKGISQNFGATRALVGANLEVRPGEVHALVGENGSGKSTLMRIVAGELPPDAGEMTLAGTLYAPVSPVEARRRGVALIHQELAQCGHLDVTENISLGAEPKRGVALDRKLADESARQALSRLGYGDLDLTKPVREYPIAIRQVIEIARAIGSGAKTIVFDEPTSSLTHEDVQRLFTVIRQLHTEGAAIVYISHFLDEVQAIASHVTVLRDGMTTHSAPVADMPNERIVSEMVGREINDLYPRSMRSTGEILLEINRLSGRRLPIEASLQLRRGEVLGIAGLNGAGRTELLRAIFALDAVKSGSIRVAGNVPKDGIPARWNLGVGMLSEDRKLEGLAIRMPIADNMTLPRLDRYSAFGNLSEARQHRASAHWIDRLKIKASSPAQPAGELSGGNQQKVAFGRLLEQDVHVLLLDEPTRGIDVGSKELIYREIDEAARSGKAVLMVSSYLPELMGVCDRIAVMAKGRLGDARPADEVTPELLMREATGIG